MSKRDFTTTISVDQAPDEVFDAINDVRGWWSGDIEGGTVQLGDEFTYQYNRFHYSKQRITESIRGKRVVWLVVDSQLSFVEDESEWNGTKVVFDIARKGDKTEVRFTHEGLVPDRECFGACSDAWTSYISVSLRGLIATGQGRPNKRVARR